MTAAVMNIVEVNVKGWYADFNKNENLYIIHFIPKILRAISCILWLSNF